MSLKIVCRKDEYRGKAVNVLLKKPPVLARFFHVKVPALPNG